MSCGKASLSYHAQHMTTWRIVHGLMEKARAISIHLQRPSIKGIHVRNARNQGAKRLIK